MPPYPPRYSDFARTALLEFVETAITAVHGPLPLAVFTCVVMMEELLGRIEPARFFDDSLVKVSGARSREEIDRARTVLIEAGWLHYEPSRPDRPGLYMVPASRATTNFVGVA